MAVKTPSCWLMLYIALALIPAINTAEDEEVDGGFGDYVPMQFLATSRSAVETGGATKTLFYDFLPAELQGKKANYLEIRSLFRGDVQVVESAQFGISVNISSRSTYDLASVEVQYTAIDDTIVLQIKNEDPMIYGGLSSLITLGIVVGAIMAIVVILTCGYLCFWLVKFETKSTEHSSSAFSASSINTFGTLSYNDFIDSDSLIKELQEEMRKEEQAKKQQTAIPELDSDQTADDVDDHPAVGNGGIYGHMHLPPTRIAGGSSSDNSNSRPSSIAHRRQRYRASTQRSRDISSSDDLSSVDDNWSKRKATWRKGHTHPTHQSIPEHSEAPPDSEGQMKVTHLAPAPKKTQFSDLEMTSGDAGFSSSNEFRPSRNRNRPGLRRIHNDSLEELEWDEYEGGEGTLPPPSAVLNGWQLSTDDENAQDDIWPPPLDEPLLASDDSDRNADGNLEEVREAIHNAMDSVNNDANASAAREERGANNPESPHDDGYETGVAVNGTSLGSPGTRLSGPPPVAPKPVRGSGAGGKFGVGRMPMTIMMSITLLSLVAGVLGVVSNLTDANIVIFVPNNYFKEINIFINDSSRISMDVSRKPVETRVHLFDASDPIIKDFTENRCDGSKACEHGCNRKTGTCGCTKGYVLFEERKCTDLSDCLYLPCKQTEECENNIGSFTCTCSENYWRDSTGECVLCEESNCPTGTFEARGCPRRVCLPCSDGCPDGQHITIQCSSRANVQCTHCSPPCLEDEFEYKPCTNLTDRMCRKISELPAAKGASNLILESVSNRHSAVSVNRLMDTPHEGQHFSAGLNRGSGISITVSVKSVNLYPALKPVVHFDSNDNQEFLNNEGPPVILTTHCPYPVPLNYELFSVLHQDVTAAKPKNCPDCAIDARKPCNTYKVFGRPAPLQALNESLVCASPNALSDMFGKNVELTDSNTMVVQPSERCEAFKALCDNCSQNCAAGLTSQRGTNCTITADDDANSWSPRLMHCQNCCLNRQCRDRCKAVQECNPVSCWRGNVAEYLLSAKFPRGQMEFYCNVELDRTIKLISLNYSVLHNDMVLKNFTIVLYQNETTVKQSSYSDGLLTIDYSTGINDIPDLIHGELDMINLKPSYTSGRYAPSGTPAIKVDVTRVDIIPKKPFAFSTKWWREQNCSETMVDDFLIRSEENMINSQPEITVSRQDLFAYSLWNRSSQPSVRFRIPVSVSVIQKLYPHTTVEEDKVKAIVSRYSSGWKLVIDGNVKTCPGYFTLKVWELNKNSPLAEYEVAVRRKDAATCHKKFSVVFDIAGGDVNRIKRQFRVEINDQGGRRNFIQAESDPPKYTGLHVNSPEPVLEYPRTISRSAILIMGPFLLVIGVTILLLSMAWIISVIIPRDYGPVKSTPNGRATLFLFYAMVRVLYTLATSLSVFVFIWYALNGKDLVIAQNYMDAVDTVISQQQHDLRTLVDFSAQTVTRQQEEFKIVRTKCFNNLQALQNQSQMRIQELSKEMSEELSSLPLRNDLVTSLDNRARELKNKLESYRQNYNAFAQIASGKLVLEISKTLEDLEKTDWLSAARMIRERVKNQRFSRASSVTGFQKWLGIRAQLNTVQANFVMEPLPINKLENLSLPAIPPPPLYKTVDLRSVFLPTHDLYLETKAPQVARADALERSYGISLGSRVSAFTVLVILLLLDILSLTSRVAETLDTGQQILDGYQIEKTYQETYQDGCSSQKYIAAKLTKKPHRVRYRMYKLILETNCVPLSVALMVVLGFTFASLLSGLNFVSLETLQSVGLFSSLVGPWNLTSNIALDNIQMNMERINMMDIPSTEAMMNHYIQRIELLNNLHNNLSYYKWQIECGDSPSARCGEFDYTKLVQALDIKDINCTLQPVSAVNPSDIPHTLTDIKVKKLVSPYIEAFRRILESSASLLLTYTSYILIVKMLSAVLWNFFTRTAFIPGVRIKITNQLPKMAEKIGDEIGDDHSDYLAHQLRFNGGTIEEMSQEGSYEDDDGGLSDIHPDVTEPPVDLGLTEENIPNGGNRVSSDTKP